MNGNVKLNKITFDKEIKRLVIEFKSKGFEMSRERAEQWYSFLKDCSDYQFEKAVCKCLKELTYNPSMADVYKHISAKSSYKDLSNYQP